MTALLLEAPTREDIIIATCAVTVLLTLITCTTHDCRRLLVEIKKLLEKK
jgi:hypothetical protein